MKVAAALFVVHIMAIAFGLLGLLVMLPHPDLWAANPVLAQFFPFGLQHGGELQMLLGAATMVAFGVTALGRRRTLIFLGVGTIIPLCAELLGTATGWPFGGYAYTDNLGLKVAGRVPYSVPLSWFYMGFAAYLLAARVLRERRSAGGILGTAALGAWLLMAWDLVLDPAMASPAIAIQFWHWHESGPYYGMPLRNLVGWGGTGLLFMLVSRLAWRSGRPAVGRRVWLPYGLYLANLLWAMTLSLSVGLWPTAVLAIVLGLAPASLALRGGGAALGRWPALGTGPAARDGRAPGTSLRP